jgi:arabinogalactan endo-1,4-beta-galactosidase
MRKILGALLLSTYCAIAGEYTSGVDVSFPKQAEDRGVVFKDNGVAKPALQIFREHGFNWARLRLFHSPTNLPNNLTYTVASAKEAKKLGFKLLLDFHYSDGWADPDKQWQPKAWAGMTHSQLVQAVFEYTRDTLRAFDEAGVAPDMVQPGNEITPGMLWPDGKLPERWNNFADLLKAGIRAIKKPTRVMIQIDRGGDWKQTKWFFDELQKRGVEFDVIGQSYYPWWHGSLADLETNMNFMAETYRKDIVVVETAYAWRSLNYRDGGAPFPETPAGQREFWEEINRIVRNSPRGCGVFWWEPAVAAGRLRARGMFDDEGNSLPVLSTGAQQRHENQ